MKNFPWVVLVGDGNGIAIAKYTTVYAGEDHERACNEADSAARINPGRPVYVLARHHKYFARQETVITVDVEHSSHSENHGSKTQLATERYTVCNKTI